MDYNAESLKKLFLPALLVVLSTVLSWKGDSVSALLPALPPLLPVATDVLFMALIAASPKAEPAYCIGSSDWPALAVGGAYEAEFIAAVCCEYERSETVGVPMRVPPGVPSCVQVSNSFFCAEE